MIQFAPLLPLLVLLVAVMMAVPAWSFTSTSVMLNVPAPDQERCVPFTEERIRMSSVPGQLAPLPLSVIVPAFETPPVPTVKSPVPTLLRVAPLDTEIVLAVRLKLVPWSKVPAA